MKIDAHQHFWLYNRTEYGWIDDRYDHLFGADSSVEEGVPVASLVFAQLRGIHEEVVFEGDQVGRSEAPSRKAEILFVRSLQRRTARLGAQILAELVPQVARGALAGHTPS